MRVVGLWLEIKSQGKEYQSMRQRDWYKVGEDKKKVNSRDKVKHNENNDQLFVQMTKKLE